MRKIVLQLAAIFFFVAPAALAQNPGLFFTDLTVASNSGGEAVSGFSGAYVTIFGNNFGAAQGTSTVTWNGLSCMRVVIWSQPWLWYQKMVVQLGSSCTPGTGNLVVTTAAGSSNALPLTVNNTGRIFFAASGGSDSNAGTIAAPFATMVKCKNVLTPGDTCYVKSGVNQPGLDNYGSLDLCTLGSPTKPLAILTYPGTAAADTIGSDTRDKGLFINSGLGSCSNGQYWTIQGFTLRANTMAGQIYNPNNRILGNFITCPAAGPGTAEGCLEPATTTNIQVLGNEITNLGSGGKLFHAIYFGADGHDYEAGWNYIHDIIGGCRAIQVYNGSLTTYNVSIHDNFIKNVACDGINLASVNPNNGFVKAYNNVVVHAGAGPDLGGQNATCMNIDGANGTGGNAVQVYNNTFYDCGALGSSDSAMLSPYIATVLNNNIIYAIGSEPYTTSGAGFANISGSHNLWFGRGNGPSQSSNNVNANPLLVNPGTDFHLQAGSPAIDAGLTITGLTADFGGISRPQGSAYDVGAMEYFAGGSTVQLPNPPTNLVVAVQ